MKLVRWGMIGCGAVTEKKSAPAYSRVAGSKLVAVASRRQSSAREYASRRGIDHVFGETADLINSDLVDAVYIATPPSSHVSLAMQAAAANKPCCVEKPLSTSHATSLQLVNAFEAAGLPLFVAYYRRSLPRFLQVKRWIDDGEIGEIRHIHWGLAREPTVADLAGDLGWRTNSKDAPGGYFDDLACHGLDLFDFLAEPIERASGFSRNLLGLYDAPDAVSASWTHQGGVTGSGFWNFAAAQRSDKVQIMGSLGRISFSVFDDNPLALETKGRRIEAAIANPDPIQLHHVENMILHLCGERVHPSLGASAARTDWVMDRILGAR